MDLRGFQKTIGHKFRRKFLLKTVFSCPEQQQNCQQHTNYERLRFLARPVLSAVLSEELFHAYPDMGQIDLVAYRDRLMGVEILGKIAKEVGLDGQISTRFILHPDRLDSIYSGSFEALLGAIFLECGLKKVRKIILRCYGVIKNRLQEEASNSEELIQSMRPNSLLEYRIITESNDSQGHACSVALYCEKELIGIGSGSNRKAAQKNAAFHALEAIFNRTKLQF
jgi:ribonuclease-3